LTYNDENDEEEAGEHVSAASQSIAVDEEAIVEIVATTSYSVIRHSTQA